MPVFFFFRFLRVEEDVLTLRFCNFCHRNTKNNGFILFFSFVYCEKSRFWKVKKSFSDYMISFTFAWISDYYCLRNQLIFLNGKMHFFIFDKITTVQLIFMQQKTYQKLISKYKFRKSQHSHFTSMKEVTLVNKPHSFIGFTTVLSRDWNQTHFKFVACTLNSYTEINKF